ncbi:MAG: hypothetical protein KBI10_09570, partial [Syntrophorhabdales bacterium]|nr:hypothetical protein [Syntrophorhabdales bacterium]
AHNPKVTGSNPVPATNEIKRLGELLNLFSYSGGNLFLTEYHECLFLICNEGIVRYSLPNPSFIFLCLEVS